MRNLIRYTGALVLPVVALLFRETLGHYAGGTLPPYFIFYPTIMCVGLAGGLWPGVLSTMASVLLAAYYILPPEGFAVKSLADLIGLIVFGAMGVGMSLVAEFYRRARYRLRQEVAERTAELSKAHEQLSLFIEHAPAGLAMFDKELRYLNVSNRWRKDYNLEGLKLIGCSHAKLFPGTPGTWESAFRRGLAGEVVQSEGERFERPDGSAQWVRWEIRPWYESPGNAGGIVIFAEDITQRIKAEQALRESEEIYRAIGESIDYGIWICKADGSNIYASDSFLKMVGLTQEQCSSFGWGDVLHPDDAERTIAAWKECVRTGGTWDIEHRFKGADGEWHPVLARGVPVRDDKGDIKYWVGINLDIKQMKLAEQTLRENAERLRFHVENSPMATIEWNADFIVTRWAGEAEKMFGWSTAETIGKPIADLHMIFEEDIPIVERTMEKLTDGVSRHVISSNRNCTKDDKVIHCEWYNSVLTDSQGRMASVMSQVLDITERKKSEEALQRSVARFELLAYTARELLQSRDPREIVQSICDKMLEYLDCQAYFNFLADEQAGRLRLNAYAGIPSAEADKIEWLDYGVAVCGCVARDGNRIVAEHIQDTPDQLTDLVRSFGIKAYACHPLIGAGGRTIGTLSFGTRSRETFSDDDLSLMKAVADQVSVAILRMNNERKMRQTNTELESMNKELEAFVYSVSHDLRAPLRAITGFAKFMKDDYFEKLDSQCRDYLCRIVNGTDRMNRLIDDLLDLSRISRQDMQQVRINISDLASEIDAGFREENPGRRVETRIMPGLTVYGDSRMIRLVLSNLLGNAWKFTSRTEIARVEFGAVEQEGRTVYFVRDNGVGFDLDYKDKMFLPFQRLHSETEFEGTGIGLTIVERIVRRHGGEVWAEGGTGKGATVFFTFS